MAILDEYGIAKGPGMIGRDCLGDLQVEANGESTAVLLGGGGWLGPAEAEVMDEPAETTQPAATQAHE